MVASSDVKAGELVELRYVRDELLRGLLEEETAAWADRLHWNFRPSADLVIRYVSLHALEGLALLDHGNVIGYGYFVSEERKGLIGDVYVVAASRTPQREKMLLDGMMNTLLRNPLIRRVEAQLMMFDPGSLAPARPPRTFERHFLSAQVGGAGRLPVRETPGVLYELWSMHWMDEASRLIAEVYRTHIDSRINDQYRSTQGARKFLQNIVQYPGCGLFHQPASWVALDEATGRLLGISLASLVAKESGHVTQICVDASHQGSGVGYELLRRTMISLILNGCTEATLTVTAANTQAIDLYHRMGFALMRRFDAMVWELD